VGWLLDSTTSCASTIKFDIIKAWKRRKKKKKNIGKKLGNTARRGGSGSWTG
jgi:hypothetical protein